MGKEDEKWEEQKEGEMKEKEGKCENWEEQKDEGMKEKEGKCSKGRNRRREEWKRRKGKFKRKEENGRRSFPFSSPCWYATESEEMEKW